MVAALVITCMENDGDVLILVVQDFVYQSTTSLIVGLRSKRGGFKTFLYVPTDIFALFLPTYDFTFQESNRPPVLITFFLHLKVHFFLQNCFHSIVRTSVCDKEVVELVCLPHAFLSSTHTRA